MQKAMGRLRQARGQDRSSDRGFEDHCWKDIIPADVIELYSNYRREVGVGPSPALLAIDLYELVYQGGPRPVPEVMKTYPNSCGEYAWAAIEPTKRLFAAARAARLPVFYSTRDTRPQGQPKNVSATRRQGARIDPALYAIRPEFEPAPEDVVIAQPRASAVDAYSHGFHVTLVEECCFDRSPISHQVNLFDMHHKYADVLHVDEAVAHLERMRAKAS